METLASSKMKQNITQTGRAKKKKKASLPRVQGGLKLLELLIRQIVVLETGRPLIYPLVIVKTEKRKYHTHGSRSRLVGVLS